MENGKNTSSAAAVVDVNAQQGAQVVPGFQSQQSFELAQRAAKLLASSSLVPKEYQGNIANCVVALNMAARMQADPLMVMQNLHIVHGRPAWSSQYLISTFNTSGKFSALRYEWVGEKGKDTFGCYAWAIEKATGDKLTGSTITIGMAKAEGWHDRTGSKWKTMPEQMLMYRAAAFFIRAYAPEIAMGMHTAEELRDTIDLSDDDFEVVEQDVATKANAEPIDIEPEPEPDTESAKAEHSKGQQTIEGPGF